MRSPLHVAGLGLAGLLLAVIALAQLDLPTPVVAVVLAVLAVAAAAGIYALIQRERSVGFRRRVERFTDPTLQDDREDTRAERAQERASLSELIVPEANVAGLTPRLGQIYFATIAGGLVLAVVAAVLLSTPWGLLAGLAAPLFTRSFVKGKVARTRKQFEQQLPDNLDVVSSALRVGHSVAGALAVTVEAADEPSRTELGRAVADEQLGVPLDVALLRVADRMRSRDLEQVAMVTRLQRDAGTNAAEVFDQVADNVRGRMDLERLVRTLTAQGRLARWIVSLLPLFLFGALYILNREYLAPLWETALGKAGMVLGVMMIMAGSFIIKKIVEIEV